MSSTQQLLDDVNVTNDESLCDFAEMIEMKLGDTESIGSSIGNPLHKNIRIEIECESKSTLFLSTSHGNLQEATGRLATKQEHRRVFSTGDLPDSRKIQEPMDPPMGQPMDPGVWSDLSPLSWIPAAAAEALNLPTMRKIVDPSDSDASSISTTAYFDPADFDKSTWSRVVNDGSAIGFAIIALATAITHPLLFLAGLLTAFGTATAAQSGYNYCTQDKWDCFDSEVAGSSKDQCDESALPVSVACTTESSMSSPNAIVAAETSLPMQNSSLPTQSSNDAVGILRLQEWLESQYPPLKEVIVKKAGPLVGINVVEFFHVFFDDDAPYNFRAFQKKRGDTDITYGSWSDLGVEGGPRSFILDSSTCALPFPTDLKYNFYQGRTLSFKAKTNSLFGPPFATTTKHQRILIVDKKRAILESRTELSDIPFADRFFIMERWVASSEKKDGRYVTFLTSCCEVVFTKSCPFEYQIKSKAISTIADVVQSWCVMAAEALKLTEKAKLNRLGRITMLEETSVSDGSGNKPHAQSNGSSQLDTSVEAMGNNPTVLIVGDVYESMANQDMPPSPRRLKNSTMLSFLQFKRRANSGRG